MITTMILGAVLVGLLVKLALMLNARRMQRAIGDSSVRTFDASDNNTLAIVPWRNDGELLGPENSVPVVRIDGQRLRAAGPQPAYTVERREPLRTATLETAFIVPSLQACAFALAGTICAATLAWVFVWSWRVPVVVFGLGLLAALFWRTRFADSLLQRVETFTGLDIDGNGTIGAPTVTPARAFTVAQPATARATAAAAIRQEAAVTKQAELLEFVRRCYLAGTSEAARCATDRRPRRRRR